MIAKKIFTNKKWYARAGKLVFLFFLLKGIFWLLFAFVFTKLF